jgi:HPt (histidine-containing phosphotransfer) domain-containing protein
MTFLKTFTGGNPDKMKKYISMFLQLCPGQLETMQTHLESGNYDSLRATAHALKPQITYMGIKKGEELVKTIEHNAGNKVDVEKLPAMMADFKSICQNAIEELKKEIA